MRSIFFQQFHAEKCDDCTIEADDGDVHEFKTYLKTRPATLELKAIEMITRVAQKYKRYICKSCIKEYH